jgi:hypothetical protein
LPLYLPELWRERRPSPLFSSRPPLFGNLNLLPIKWHQDKLFEKMPMNSLTKIFMPFFFIQEKFLPTEEASFLIPPFFSLPRLIRLPPG